MVSKLLKLFIALVLLFVVVPAVAVIFYLCWEYAQYIFSAVMVIVLLILAVAALFKAL